MRIVVLLYTLVISITLYASNDWLGRWQTDPISVDNETLVMEYDFKNDTSLSMCFFTDNWIPTVGRCVSKVTIDGIYQSVGPIFFVSLDDKSLNVEILKLYTKDSGIKEKYIEKYIRENAEPLFSGYDNVRMIFVTHENTDEISFIYGDVGNAMNMDFHRPNQSIEQIFKIAEEEPVVTKSTEADDSKTLSPIAKIWKSLGYFFIYMIVAFPLIFFLKLLFAKHIKRTNTVKKSVNIRRVYYVIRFFVGITVLIIGFLLWLPLLRDTMDINQYMGAIVLCGGGGLLLYVYSSLSLPLNFTTMSSFLRKKRTFILYLRGFVTDNYTPKMEYTAKKVSETRPWSTKNWNNENKIDPSNLPLIERDLAKAWKKQATVYSVGLPEELESPEGSKRIYLDNQTWQADVIQLMSDAKYILIRVNPNDNCIWEIQQCCLFYSCKTIYYIESIELLEEVQKKMGTSTPLCLMSPRIDKNHMYAYQKNGEIIAQSYDNSLEGFTKSAYDIKRSLTYHIQSEDIEPEQERNGSVGDSTVDFSYLHRWNWGAAGLYPIWGLFNGCWWAALCLLVGWISFPIVNIIFGIYGSRWAWRYGKWDNFRFFCEKQRKWRTLGIVALCFILLLYLLLQFV